MRSVNIFPPPHPLSCIIELYNICAHTIFLLIWSCVFVASVLITFVHIFCVSRVNDKSDIKDFHFSVSIHHVAGHFISAFERSSVSIIEHLISFELYKFILIPYKSFRSHSNMRILLLILAISTSILGCGLHLSKPLDDRSSRATRAVCFARVKLIIIIEFRLLVVLM